MTANINLQVFLVWIESKKKKSVYTEIFESGGIIFRICTKCTILLSQSKYNKLLALVLPEYFVKWSSIIIQKYGLASRDYASGFLYGV